MKKTPTENMYVCISMEIQADMHRKKQKELATIELK